VFWFLDHFAPVICWCESWLFKKWDSVWQENLEWKVIDNRWCGLLDVLRPVAGRGWRLRMQSLKWWLASLSRAEIGMIGDLPWTSGGKFYRFILQMSQTGTKTKCSSFIWSQNTEVTLLNTERDQWWRRATGVYGATKQCLQILVTQTTTVALLRFKKLCVLIPPLEYMEPETSMTYQSIL
jgi:hypothetical protein